MDTSEAGDSTAVPQGEIDPALARTETWQGEQYIVVEEGKAKILYPVGHQVFYNPVQEYNRDMSVMMLRLFAEDWHFKGMAYRWRSIGLAREPPILAFYRYLYD